MKIKGFSRTRRPLFHWIVSLNESSWGFVIDCECQVFVVMLAKCLSAKCAIHHTHRVFLLSLGLRNDTGVSTLLFAARQGVGRLPRKGW